jgi:cytochrome oxidase assembly protein ShyY1
MFLAFGGVIAMQDGILERPEVYGALATLTAFIVLMGLGVWHVFRRRGRIYI